MDTDTARKYLEKFGHNELQEICNLLKYVFTIFMKCCPCVEGCCLCIKLHTLWVDILRKIPYFYLFLRYVKRCLKILFVSSFFPPFLLERKGLKISSSKKVRIQGWLKLAQFLLIEIWRLPTLHSFISGISPSIFKILVPILLQIS